MKAFLYGLLFGVGAAMDIWLGLRLTLEILGGAAIVYVFVILGVSWLFETFGEVGR